MSGLPVFSISPFPILRFGTAAAVLAAAIGLVLMLGLRGENLPHVVTVHALTFYGVTSGAYLALPFIRRGDIAMVAMWLVLGAGVAPCFAGQELSALRMFSDMAGVLLAAAPIYIARHRQLAQGDTRHPHRRESERASAADAVEGQASPA